LIQGAVEDLRRVMRSFGFASAGIITMLVTQPNARVHLAAMLIVIALCVTLPLSPIESALMVVAIAIVLVAESFNTAIEAVVDLASPDIHPLARRAKDVAAGGVLIAAMAAAAIGVLVLWPRLAWLIQR
jgi:diacylglycerol kinase (ATP)